MSLRAMKLVSIREKSKYNFVFPLIYANFALSEREDRLHLNKKRNKFLCFVFDLHYL